MAKLNAVSVGFLMGSLRQLPRDEPNGFSYPARGPVSKAMAGDSAQLTFPPGQRSPRLGSMKAGNPTRGPDRGDPVLGVKDRGAWAKEGAGRGFPVPFLSPGFSVPMKMAPLWGIAPSGLIEGTGIPQ
jgi:hypothetical protein